MMNLRTAASGPDFNPTPAWAVRALLSIEKFEGLIHEPCCGHGHMVRALESGGYKVIASDLYDYGCIYSL